jgi:hypothetical protein
MSMKASTAALEPSASRSLPNQRRAPRHPAGAKRSASASEARRPRTKDRATKFHVVQTAILREEAMNATNPFAPPIHHKTILPLILRITFSLLLWTLGLASMNLVELASLPTARTTAQGTKSIYTSASFDGRITYKVTLRYRWLLPVAGGLDQIVWAPVRIETITRPVTDEVWSAAASLA